MNRSRGEISKSKRNRDYPFQVVILFTSWHRQNLHAYIADRNRLGGYRLASSVRHDLTLFHVDHFPSRAAQSEFIALWGGLAHDPADKNSRPWESYFEQDHAPQNGLRDASGAG